MKFMFFILYCIRSEFIIKMNIILNKDEMRSIFQIIVLLDVILLIGLGLVFVFVIDILFDIELKELQFEFDEGFCEKCLEELFLLIDFVGIGWFIVEIGVFVRLYIFLFRYGSIDKNMIIILIRFYVFLLDFFM